MRIIRPCEIWNWCRPDAAATVTVETGEERGGINIRTSLVPTSRINGTVRAAFGSVAMGGDDRTVDLTLQPGMSVSGRFAFEGAAGAGWGLRSIIANGRDLLDAPFELQPNESIVDAVVTFTANPSDLSGTLQNASGVPTSDYFIVVFTPDQKFWFPSSRRIVSVRPDTNGTYRLSNLPPGEYLVAALTDIADGEWFDPDFLQALESSSPSRITIAAGEKKRLDLRISK